MTRIHQLLSGAGPVDAVTSQAFAYRRLFESWGMAGEVHAGAIEPRLSGVKPLKSLDAAPEDLLLVHYSAYSPKLRPLLELPQRKLLVYHNVTPAHYLWAHQPHVATLCALGRDQLPVYAQAVDVAAGVSGYNARELEEAGARDVRVVPILFDEDRLAAHGRPPAGGSGPLVLSVGRLVPHKRHDLAIRAFALYQREREPEARLLVVGEPLSPGYGEWLEQLARDAGARSVTFAGVLPQPALNEAYRDASLLLSTSEHEGFCVPLLEAFSFQLPVVARPVGGMPEVGGDAVLWCEDDDLAVWAELMHVAVTDEPLREELAQRGTARLGEFAHGRVADRLREAVDAALA